MGTRARPLGAKLFLEGLEVPLIGATITTSVGSASVAYVDVVPHASLNNIKPRTHVAIAVRDPNNAEENYPYVLAWEGEVFGFSFNKTPQSRMMTLTCIDYTSYWDNALVYYFNAQSSLANGGGSLLPVGVDFTTAKANNIPVVPISHSSTSLFRTIIEGVLAAEKPTLVDGKLVGVKSNDLLDGFIAVIAKLTDINSFYNAAENRLKISERIVLRSSGQLQDLIAQKEALAWFHDQLGEQTGFQTLRTSIMELMSILFHDQVTIPFPSFTVSETTKKVKPLQFVFKPNLYMIAPPMCNIFYPDEYSSFSFNRNFFREPTRLIYKPELPMLLNNETISCPVAYAPENFKNFMFNKKLTEGTTEFAVPKGTASDLHFGKDIAGVGSDAKNTIQAREQNFLSNEERYKGILFAIEQMVPASSSFRASLEEPQRRDFTAKVADYLLAKKRFQTRETQVTSHLKMSVVPGFTALIMDPGDAGQNIIAYCSSVTHRIYATEGGYTNTTLSYARTVEEQQNTSTDKSDPLVPPWLKAEIFGTNSSRTAPLVDKDTGEPFKDENGKPVVIVGPSMYTGGKNLSLFYKDLLGGKGYTALTDISGSPKTLVESVSKLIAQYNKKKKENNPDMFDFIAKQSDRDYMRVRESMEVLGAKTKNGELRNTEFWTAFTGGAFSPESGSPEEVRANVIRKYRAVLEAKRGFKG